MPEFANNAIDTLTALPASPLSAGPDFVRDPHRHATAFYEADFMSGTHPPKIDRMDCLARSRRYCTL